MDRRLFLRRSSGLFVAAAPALILPGRVASAFGPVLPGPGLPKKVASGSFTTFNSARKSTFMVLSNGDLTTTATGGNATAMSIANHTTGKYYCEMISQTGTAAYAHGMGIANLSYDVSVSVNVGISNAAGLWSGDTTIYINNSGDGTDGTYGNPVNDVVSMAVDLDNNRIWFRVNGGNWNNSVSNDPATNTGGRNISAITGSAISVQSTVGDGRVNTFNFGATAYAYAPPSGFGNW